MGFILSTLNMVWDVFKTFEFIDIVDVLLFSYLIYKGWNLIRETRAYQLVKGILLLTLAYLVAQTLELKMLTFVLSKTFDIGLFALLVIFQPELRRILEKVGRTKVRGLGILNLGTQENDDISVRWENAIGAIIDSCDELAATTTGALIVIERQTKLGEQIDTGTVLNAIPTRELFGNIFYPKTPLHDGAVIMREGMILAAACFLPKPQNEEMINKQLGSRHRAAIGMSENSDAVVIIVSEETGTISVAENGELSRGFTRDSLRKLLRTRLIPEKPLIEKEKKLAFWRTKQK